MSPIQRTLNLPSAGSWHTTSSSAIAERPCDACSSTVILSVMERCCWRKCVEWAILRRRVNLGLNVRLKGYVSRQYLWTVRLDWEDVYITTLALEVFTQRNFVADFIRLNPNFPITRYIIWPQFQKASQSLQLFWQISCVLPADMQTLQTDRMDGRTDRCTDIQRGSLYWRSASCCYVYYFLYSSVCVF